MLVLFRVPWYIKLVRASAKFIRHPFVKAAATGACVGAGSVLAAKAMERLVQPAYVKIADQLEAASEAEAEQPRAS